MILNIECQECNGIGYTENQECDKPASMCCGGCFIKVCCEECESAGKYDVEIDISDVIALVESKEISSNKI